MTRVTTITGNQLKQQYSKKKTAPEFDITDTGKSIDVHRSKTNDAGPAAILTLSDEALTLLNLKH